MDLLCTFKMKIESKNLDHGCIKDFEGAKNFYDLQVLIWDFGGHWRFLTGVWHLDLDLDMLTAL